MSKRTRNRHLAKQAAKRYADKRYHQRRRQMGTIAVALVVALAGSVLAVIALNNRGDEPPPAASGTTGPSGTSGPSGATGETGPQGDPGTQTGTVQPEPGPEVVACGAQMPRGALRPKPQFNAPADVTQRGKTYTATFETSCGDIVIELLSDQAPETVNSFVFLAEQGYFDGTRIHRIDDSIDVLQGGDPTGTGTGGPGYSVPDELTGDESYVPGTLAMANSGAPNSGGSQFFLIAGEDGTNLDANPAYTIFGRVVEGLDIAEAILGLPIADPDAAAAGDITGQQPRDAVYIEKVTISTEHG